MTFTLLDQLLPHRMGWWILNFSMLKISDLGYYCFLVVLTCLGRLSCFFVFCYSSNKLSWNFLTKPAPISLRSYFNNLPHMLDSKVWWFGAMLIFMNFTDKYLITSAFGILFHSLEAKKACKHLLAYNQIWICIARGPYPLVLP